MVLTRATNQPGRRRHPRHRRRHPRAQQHHLAVRRPEPDLLRRIPRTRCSCAPTSSTPPASRSRPASCSTNRDLGADGKFGTADDVEIGGMATWAVVKAQARDILGINLTDADVVNVPLLATDAYGNFIPGPNGFPQVVMKGADGLAGTADDVLVEGNPAGADRASPTRCAPAMRSSTTSRTAPCRSSTAAATWSPIPTPTMQRRSTLAGGRHLRQRAARRALHRRRRPREREHRPHRRPRDLPLRAQPAGRADQGHGSGVAATSPSSTNGCWRRSRTLPTTPAQIAALQWNGERLFQAAKFGTEMQYQHLVFEEFARTVQPNDRPLLRADPGLRRRPRSLDRRGVRAHGLSLRPLDADRDGRPLRRRLQRRRRPSIPISRSA